MYNHFWSFAANVHFASVWRLLPVPQLTTSMNLESSLILSLSREIHSDLSLSVLLLSIAQFSNRLGISWAEFLAPPGARRKKTAKLQARGPSRMSGSMVKNKALDKAGVCHQLVPGGSCSSFMVECVASLAAWRNHCSHFLSNSTMRSLIVCAKQAIAATHVSSIWPSAQTAYFMCRISTMLRSRGWSSFLMVRTSPGICRGQGKKENVNDEMRGEYGIRFGHQSQSVRSPGRFK